MVAVKKAILLLIAVILVSCSPVTKQFVSACDGYSKVMFPNYKEYIRNDATLSDTTKNIRIATVDQFQRMIDSAQAKINRK
jgi:hypothetical protein